jgi:hypothetical protein
MRGTTLVAVCSRGIDTARASAAVARPRACSDRSKLPTPWTATKAPGALKPRPPLTIKPPAPDADPASRLAGCGAPIPPPPHSSGRPVTGRAAAPARSIQHRDRFQRPTSLPGMIALATDHSSAIAGAHDRNATRALVRLTGTGRSDSPDDERSDGEPRGNRARVRSSFPSGWTRRDDGGPRSCIGRGSTAERPGARFWPSTGSSAKGPRRRGRTRRPVTNAGRTRTVDQRAYEGEEEAADRCRETTGVSAVLEGSSRRSGVFQSGAAAAGIDHPGGRAWTAGGQRCR